jgi:DNA-binding PadR family transcriptional regulator
MNEKKRIETHNLVRHCNEDLILAILHSGVTHGYELALEIEKRSEGYFRFNHGTLYPILHKLEKEGLIKGSWKKEGSKRKRKQYLLTKKGNIYITAQLDAWREFYKHFFGLMEGVDK